MLTKHRITSVAIEEDGGLQISYYTPERDVKAAGVVKLHTLIVPAGFDYDDEIDAVIDAVTYLINDVDDDWERLPGVDQSTPMQP
jgi:hypothetical protein